MSAQGIENNRSLVEVVWDIWMRMRKRKRNHQPAGQPVLSEWCSSSSIYIVSNSLNLRLKYERNNLERIVIFVRVSFSSQIIKCVSCPNATTNYHYYFIYSYYDCEWIYSSQQSSRKLVLDSGRESPFANSLYFSGEIQVWTPLRDLSVLEWCSIKIIPFTLSLWIHIVWNECTHSVIYKYIISSVCCIS
jgi:hypothetical protein